MRINLAEIPEEGRSYIWNSQTKELSATLADLIGSTPHHAEFFIKPLNPRDFELSGLIRTELPEVCSRCGIDFSLAVNEKFREILIPRQADDRTGKYAKANHVSETSDDGPSVAEYDGTSFDMGEYLHEVVGLATPFNPVPPENEKGDCRVCHKFVRGQTFKYDEEMPSEVKENPFAALKNLKLN